MAELERGAEAAGQRFSEYVRTPEGSRLYREHRTALYSLGTRHRTVLYCAAGVAALDISAYDRLTATGVGTVIWILVVAGAAYTIYAVYRSTKQY